MSLEKLYNNELTDFQIIQKWAGLNMQVIINKEFMTDSRQRCNVPEGTYTVRHNGGGGMRNATVTLTDGEDQYTVDEFYYRQGREKGWIKEAL